MRLSLCPSFVQEKTYARRLIAKAIKQSLGSKSNLLDRTMGGSVSIQSAPLPSSPIRRMKLTMENRCRIDPHWIHAEDRYIASYKTDTTKEGGKATRLFKSLRLLRHTPESIWRIMRDDCLYHDTDSVVLKKPPEATSETWVSSKKNTMLLGELSLHLNHTWSVKDEVSIKHKGKALATEEWFVNLDTKTLVHYMQHFPLFRLWKATYFLFS